MKKKIQKPILKIDKEIEKVGYNLYRGVKPESPSVPIRITYRPQEKIMSFENIDQFRNALTKVTVDQIEDLAKGLLLITKDIRSCQKLNAK